jgi:hypothetical protein
MVTVEATLTAIVDTNTSQPQQIGLTEHPGSADRAAASDS